VPAWQEAAAPKTEQSASVWQNGMQRNPLGVERQEFAPPQAAVEVQGFVQ
jgi:hypothetical protein